MTTIEKQWNGTSRRAANCLVIALLASIAWCGISQQAVAQHSVARQWNEAILDAIRIDFPAPTVHARNLYHTSAAMYDAWAAFDQVAQGSFFTEKYTAADTSAARDEAISYAAYRVLSHRYALANDPAASQLLFDNVMGNGNYDTNVTTTVGDSPAAIGNRIAAKVLADSLGDGSNENNNYVDTTGYAPINPPMTVDYPAVVPQFSQPLDDPNRWQPLFVDSAFTQNGLLGTDLQEFVGPHWGNVTPFAMGRTGNPQPTSWSGFDPGVPPKLGGVGDQEYRDDTVLLVEYSNSLDPTQGPGAEMINISPNTAGNRTLGTHDDQGYPSKTI